MLYDSLPENGLSPALILFGYSLYIFNQKIFNYITYLIVSVMITATNVFHGEGPEDIINILAGYAVFFALNELIYRQRGYDVKIGG